MSMSLYSSGREGSSNQKGTQAQEESFMRKLGDQLTTEIPKPKQNQYLLLRTLSLSEIERKIATKKLDA
jgi:hypothetical protein